MSEHPLQFFKLLVDDPRGIDKLKGQFLPTSHPDLDIEGDPLNLESNWEEGYYVMLNPLSNEPATITYYFSDHLDKKCKDEKLEFLKILDTHVLNEEDEKKASAYLKRILTEIHFLISQGYKIEKIQKYPIITQTLQEIKDHLIVKYGVVDISNKNVIQATGNSKIQWLGKTNVLTTLFYDLLNGQDKGEPYIHANKKDVMKFLLDNFLDKEGNELSESTIQSYFDKQEKKAKIGDRIELPNKRVTR